jgi:hypothetical protein
MKCGNIDFILSKVFYIARIYIMFPLFSLIYFCVFRVVFNQRGFVRVAFNCSVSNIGLAKRFNYYLIAELLLTLYFSKMTDIQVSEHLLFFSSSRGANRGVFRCVERKGFPKATRCVPKFQENFSKEG